MKIDIYDNSLIGRLIDRYLEGETDNSEESVLRNYFTQQDADIPGEWQYLKALFTYEKAEATKLHEAETAKTLATEATTTPATASDGKKKTKRSSHSLSRRLLYTASIAASLLIIISVFLSMPKDNGNFAVVDGQVFTDKNIVSEEAEEALMLVSSNENDTFDAFKEFD